MDYSAAKNKALEALKTSELGHIPHLVAAWNSLKWTESDDTGQTIGAQVNFNDPNRICLFPALLHEPEPQQTAAILREFGISLAAKASAEAKTGWELKYCLPDKEQVDAVQGKLKSDEYHTFRELTESFKTAMDRLVCLNICNALLVNGLCRNDARNLNIFQWGATADYANLKRYHSIKPLLFAYADRKIVECPGQALGALVAHGLDQVRESSVQAAFRKVVLGFFRACR